MAFKLLYKSIILRNTKHNTNETNQQVESLARLSDPVPERTTTMTALCTALIHDESGFIVSAELVLVATIAVLAMVVGLSEIAINVNNELEDVGSAFGSLNQSYCVRGSCGHGGHHAGSMFDDTVDQCDASCDVQTCGRATGESDY